MRTFALVLSTVATLACIAFSTQAFGEGLVIWNPTKAAPYTYQATLGFRLPARWETSAGADLGLSGSATGAIANGSQVAAIWGKLQNRSAGGGSDRDLALRIDMVTGTGTFSYDRLRGMSLFNGLDLTSSRSVSVAYQENAERQATASATQALTLTYASLGTSISASGSLSAQSGSDFTHSLGVNQPIGDHLNFSAAVTDAFKDTRSGDLRLNYKVAW